jgi:hypothetical protein
MPRSARKNPRRRLYTQLTVAAVILVAAFFRPRFEAWLQGKFPELGESAETTTLDSSPSIDFTDQSASELESSSTGSKTGTTEVGDSKPHKSTLTPTVAANTTNSERKDRSGASQSRESGDEPPPGKLKLIGKNVFRSTAGLIYGSGSREGHRLKHAKDDLSKPVHGVFDGDRDQILRWIDLAYMKTAQGGGDVRKRQENRRTAWTIKMKEKIGHAGGHRNQDKKKRECRYLKLVIEDDNKTVVTAYPTSSL